MENIVKIYKNLLPEEERLSCLNLILQFPENILTQSVCTDEDVQQIRDFMPLKIAKSMFELHRSIRKDVQVDFDLRKDNITLKEPQYMKNHSTEFLTIDRRIPGMSLSSHRDIPTGTFEKHFGLEEGMTDITMSGIYYWNDNFDGGELVFDEDGLKPESEMTEIQKSDKTIMKSPYKYKPVAGDFVVFPSHLYHEILEVTNGNRYSTQYFFNRTVRYNAKDFFKELDKNKN